MPWESPKESAPYTERPSSTNEAANENAAEPIGASAALREVRKHLERTHLERTHLEALRANPR